MAVLLAEGKKEVVVGEAEGAEAEGGEDKEEETHRSTLENGLCPGVLLSLDVLATGAELLAEALFAFTAGLALVGVLRAPAVAGLEEVAFGLLGEGDDEDEGDEELIFNPALSRSARSCLPLTGVALLGDADEDGGVVTHLWESGCRCVAQNCLLQDYTR